MGAVDTPLAGTSAHVARTALLVVADDLGDFGLKNHEKTPVHSCLYLGLLCIKRRCAPPRARHGAALEIIFPASE